MFIIVFFYGQVVVVKPCENATEAATCIAVLKWHFWDDLALSCLEPRLPTCDRHYFWAHEQSRSLLGLPDYIPSSSQINGNGNPIN